MAIWLGGKEKNSGKDWLTTETKVDQQPPSAFKELAQDYAKYEPQRDNHFELVIDFGRDANKLLRWGAYEEEKAVSPNNYFEDVDDVLRVSLATAFLPEIGVNTINVPRGNSDVVYAGKPNIGHSGTVSFNDWIGVRTYDICLAWFQLVYNMKTEKVGLAQDYKREAHIFQYTPTWQLVRAWDLSGVFPTNVKGGDLTYEGGNAQMKVNMTLSYDKFNLNYQTLSDFNKNY